MDAFLSSDQGGVRMTALVLTVLSIAAGTQGPEAGFQPLFNGRDLGGWVYGQKIGAGYRVQGGVVFCTEADCGILYTEKEYADFVLRLELRLGRDANNGIAVRAPIAAVPWR